MRLQGPKLDSSMARGSSNTYMCLRCVRWLMLRSHLPCQSSFLSLACGAATPTTTVAPDPQGPHPSGSQKEDPFPVPLPRPP